MNARGFRSGYRAPPKRWVVWYQANGKRRRVTLGAVASLKLKEARVQAGRIMSEARDGKDALAERETAKAKAADTLGKLIDLYLERRAKPRQRQRTYTELERYLRKRWAPLHDRPLESITRRDIAARLEEIRVDHGPISANRARTYLGSAFTWAMRQGLTESNPVIGTEPPAAETERDRVLSPEELAIVWQAAGAAGEFGTIVRLLMDDRTEARGSRGPGVARVRSGAVPVDAPEHQDEEQARA
jgi:hypothetical protein